MEYLSITAALLLLAHYIIKASLAPYKDKRVRRMNGTIARKVPVREYGHITGYIYL